MPGVEDIHITGCDLPVLRMADGSVRTAGAPVADTDADLVQQLQHIAAHHGLAVNTLAAQVDSARPPEQGLASALRVYVLEWYQRHGEDT